MKYLGYLAITGIAAMLLYALFHYITHGPKVVDEETFIAHVAGNRSCSYHGYCYGSMVKGDGTTAYGFRHGTCTGSQDYTADRFHQKWHYSKKPHKTGERTIERDTSEGSCS
ncbi:formate dehydrogenase N subunit beta [Citromicrobium phage vB_CbaS-RXM]|nr:formate dehydrogenase N subunit beta [Citromicrobium phage vB_CbaS-RXM]